MDRQALWNRAQGFSRARLSHQVRVVRLPGGRLLHIQAVLQNTGTALLELGRFRTSVHKMSPLSPAEQAAVEEALKEDARPLRVPWPTTHVDEKNAADKGEVEPGETEKLCSEVILPTSVDVVQIVTYVRNCAKPSEIGWSKTTIVDLTREENHMPKKPMADYEKRQYAPREVVLPKDNPVPPMTPMPQTPPRDIDPPPPSRPTEPKPKD